ncbi:hypothetical protein ACKKBG_A12745 [Auxenochlorella protothecoides x Auxenochlorella symbiontica]|uniref:Cysteine-rich PDZ-binding protein n=1 Tax=Auxenochlorella protothecoides TaxID=3075 RepID=A0A087SEE5_AUXPR|nr:Cysteine-rich PDZ-binding protein [Auxenochlorella protothecoides]KFM24099.1 Cysteine-rich PDZ-binding protein [Auxenochlorella protothecoides]RMZ55296.1 hypothetical protein APUTEX25_003434 [Auxenochlorella protothecoides]|eukprot:RMZ55296.1 hypothetical protein APUTEX25_003434 [Auxenochlorella protothecoides]
MVCTKCEKKLAKVACPDKWKDGANNTVESGGRKVNENKMLSKKRGWQPYAAKCTLCKNNLQAGYTYCQGCAYRDGLCAMCGKKILDTSSYRQSNK